jgi:hypothetical protein
VPPDEIPKVELEMPSVLPSPSPAINEMPSLFDPPRPSRSESAGTAVRIVKPASSSAVAVNATPSAVEPQPDQPKWDKAPSPIRMRFATTIDQAPASATAATPRMAVGGSAAPRRPQWSPYR